MRPATSAAPTESLRQRPSLRSTRRLESQAQRLPARASRGVGRPKPRPTGGTVRLSSISMSVPVGHPVSRRMSSHFQPSPGGMRKRAKRLRISATAVHTAAQHWPHYRVTRSMADRLFVAGFLVERQAGRLPSSTVSRAVQPRSSSCETRPHSTHSSCCIDRTSPRLSTSQHRTMRYRDRLREFDQPQDGHSRAGGGFEPRWLGSRPPDQDWRHTMMAKERKRLEAMRDRLEAMKVKLEGSRPRRRRSRPSIDTGRQRD